jgi:hypothetical protein
MKDTEKYTARFRIPPPHSRSIAGAASTPVGDEVTRLNLLPAPSRDSSRRHLRGKAQLQCKKLGFTGIRIEVDRGTGSWTFLDIATKPHYEDPASPAPGATVLWKYRAIYLDGDTVFGQWSDVGSIAVTG